MRQVTKYNIENKKKTRKKSKEVKSKVTGNTIQKRRKGGEGGEKDPALHRTCN